MNFKMLVVDDDDGSRELITMYAKSCQFEVLEAESFSSAEKILDSEDVQALFVDQNLTDGKGMDLIRKVNEKKMNIPSIIYTGNDPMDLLDEALELGAYDIISKPSPSKFIKLKFKNLHRLILAEKN